MRNKEAVHEPFVPSHPPSSVIPYLISVVFMSMLGVGSTLAVLILRPAADNAALFASIAGFVAPTTMALLAFIKTQETHVLVNGRMDEFKRLLQANADRDAREARNAEDSFSNDDGGRGRGRR